MRRSKPFQHVRNGFKAGDRIIYRMRKHTSRPGPRARAIDPERQGNYYTYEVEKFWVVDEVNEDGTVLAVTRRGKKHVIDPSDPQVRRASWWERLRWAGRFPDRSSNDRSHGTDDGASS